MESSFFFCGKVILGQGRCRLATVRQHHEPDYRPGKLFAPNYMETTAFTVLFKGEGECGDEYIPTALMQLPPAAARTGD